MVTARADSYWLRSERARPARSEQHLAAQPPLRVTLEIAQHTFARKAEGVLGKVQCALVVGATWPAQLAEVRAIVGNLPLLVPGVGAQGGDVEAIVRNGKTAEGTGLVISSSRAILYASSGAGYADAARTAAGALREEINRYR